MLSVFEVNSEIFDPFEMGHGNLKGHNKANPFAEDTTT